MYDPVKETMKAATRQNDPERPASKLEYTVDKQFLNYLDTKRAELAGSQSPVGT